MSKIADGADRIKGFVFDVDGVLSSAVQQIGGDGNLIRTANVRDGYAIKLAQKAGFELAIISGGDSEGVRERYRLLGMEDVFMGVRIKLPVMEKWIEAKGLRAEEVAFMGDDLPDLPCMRKVGLAAAPYDAAAEVIRTASFVSKHGGGYGCVRDLIESVMRAQGCWKTQSPTAV